jgi:hypothetical protein
MKQLTITHQNKKARNLEESSETNIDFLPEQDDDNPGTMTNCQDIPIKVLGYRDFGHNMGKASDKLLAQNATFEPGYFHLGQDDSPLMP